MGMESEENLKVQCPLLRPAISPVSDKAPIAIEPNLDADRDVYEAGHGRRVIDVEGPMTIDVAGICLACHDAVTSARVDSLCGTSDHMANCPIFPEKFKIKGFLKRRQNLCPPRRPKRGGGVGDDEGTKK